MAFLSSMNSHDQRVWLVDVEVTDNRVRAGWCYFGPGRYSDFVEVGSGAEVVQFQIPPFLRYVPAYATLSEPDDFVDFIRVK